MLLRAIDVTTSTMATLSRLAYGEIVGSLGPRPDEPLELYEFEASPYCRKVREALTVLDLDAVIYPCPKGAPRYRTEVARRGGKQLFPYLVDPNTGVEMYESDDINAYLFERYGNGRVPLPLAAGLLTTATSVAATVWRLPRGLSYRRSNPPALPLELYSYEGCPFCRIVREALSELELAYLLHNVARRSPRRDDFVQRSGKKMVPYLIDPNQDVAMFESADIVRYLNATYAESR